MKNQIIWTAICSVIFSVITTLIFKAMEIDSGGWAGGIGAGLGVSVGTYIAAKINKKEEVS